MNAIEDLSEMNLGGVKEHHHGAWSRNLVGQSKGEETLWQRYTGLGTGYAASWEIELC